MNLNAWIFILPSVIFNIRALDSRRVNNMMVSGGFTPSNHHHRELNQTRARLDPIRSQSVASRLLSGILIYRYCRYCMGWGLQVSPGPDPSLIMRIEGGWVTITTDHGAVHKVRQCFVMWLLGLFFGASKLGSNRMERNNLTYFWLKYVPFG